MQQIMIEVVSLREDIKFLYSFITSNDSQWKDFSIKFQIQLTKDVIKLFAIMLTIGHLGSWKSLLNIVVLWFSAIILHIFTRHNTVSIMNWVTVALIILVPWLRVFLVGNETLLYNQIYISVAVLPMMMFSKSYIFTGVIFIYVLIFVKFVGKQVIQNFKSSPANFENTLLYLVDHFHIICSMILIYAVVSVYHNQIIIAQLWKKQKETEALLQQLEKQNQVLKNVNQSKNKLLLSLSHEFRNPINAALGNLELAREKSQDSSIEKYLSNCKVSIEMLFHLVSNLLDSTKLEAGVLELNPLSKGPRAIFQKVWDIVKNLVDKQNLLGEFFIHKKIPKTLNVDSHFITKIFLNLILNSLKFTNQGAIMVVVSWLDDTKISENTLQPSQAFLSMFLGTTLKKFQRHIQESACLELKNLEKSNRRFLNGSEISTETNSSIESKIHAHSLTRMTSLEEIELFHNIHKNYEKLSNENNNSISYKEKEEQKKETKKKGLLKVEVFDSGCGIDPKIKDNIFKKFSSDKKEGDRLGAGLGLWLTKNLCRIMDGEIKVHSETNKGSQFVAVFPLETADSIDSSLNCTGSRAISALVVDDNKYNREIHTAFLKKAGAIVKDEAANGAEAVQLFISKPPCYYDLILMDLEMPIMGGKNAVRNIRLIEKLEKRTPSKIVIVTGNCDLAEYSACMNNEGDIRADFFYRKPLFQKDVEEFVQRISQKNTTVHEKY